MSTTTDDLGDGIIKAPLRCCHLRRGKATRHRRRLRRCPHDATLTIVDGDPREATYVCGQHRDAYDGEAFPLGSG